MSVKKIIIMGIIGFTSLSFAGVSIANVEEMSTFEPQLEGNYELISKNGTQFKNVKPTLIISGEKGNYRISGKGGCNGYGGYLQEVNEKFKVGNMMSTQKMCHGEAMMVEQDFMNMLRNENTWTTKGNELFIQNSKITLIFKIK